MSVYTYDVSADFPGGKVNISRLLTEIDASSILTSLKNISSSGGTISVGVLTGGSITINFKATLSAADKTKLDGDTTGPAGGLIAAHNNAPTDPQPLLREDGALYAVPKAASYGYEMCDRDFRLNTCIMDAKAMHTVANGANGTVTYVAARSGAHGNNHTIEVTAGATGVGNEDRELTVVRTGEDILVTFGTNSNGDPLVPTANDVATAINSDYDIALHYLNAVPSGDGTGAVGEVAKTNLAGGTTASCEDLKLNVTSMKEEDWGELTLLGVYKDNAGTMEECADQADANVNGILSVWEYTAIHPYTGDLLEYEIRDGYLIVDTSLPANEKWNHRIYAVVAPLIPGNLGGSVRMFDGYMGMAPNGLIDAKSQQASVLDPTKGPGASQLRCYVYHPAGSKLSHVLRLVTYRKPGTF